MKKTYSSVYPCHYIILIYEEIKNCLCSVGEREIQLLLHLDVQIFGLGLNPFRAFTLIYCALSEKTSG